MSEPAATKSDVVSAPSESLILVDREDATVGALDKLSCHQGSGTLHRALSVFLFDDAGRVLLQQRAAEKPLWPLYWSNSCCSHPRVGETVEGAAARRTFEELGLTTAPRFVYKFEYRAPYDNGHSEHELCHVFVGRAQGSLERNTTEVAATRWLQPAELDAILAGPAPDHTPWLKMEWTQLRGPLSHALEGLDRD
ncbi:MAG: isopentenyl-diphosphate Delta-isomerase [Pseudomonadota bacterium]